jgi:uncharacterized protein (TIGR02099 family)
MTAWNARMQRLSRWVAGLVGLAALLLALGIGAFRLAVELLPGYEARVVERVRETTGLTLEFDSVYGRIGRYGPEVVFRGARVLPASGGEPLVTAAAGRVSLSIPRSIWYRRPELARVALVRPRLQFVITPDGRVRLVGQSAWQRAPDAEPMTLDRVPRGRFAVTDATLEVLDLRARQGRFELTGADLELVRRGDEIALTGHVDLPDHLGRAIDVEAEAGGDLRDGNAIAWRARVEASRVELAEWSAMLPDGFRVPPAGRGSFRVSARGTGPRVTSLRFQPQLEGLQLAQADPGFTRLAGDIRLQRDDTTISLEASDFELSRPGAPWKTPRLDARLTLEDGRFASVAARADSIRVENLAALAVVLPQGTIRDRLATLAPRGLLRALDVTVTAVADSRVPDVEGGFRFADVSFGPLGRAAGITGFDGTLEGRGEGGIVTLATRDATVDWPQQLRAPIPVQHAEGRLEWRRFGSGLRLWLDDAFGDSGHGSARGQLRMLLRPGELPLLDLRATATGFEVTQTWRYLQTGRLSPKAIAWLDAAFRAGRVTTADVSITGPTKGFPYREGQGVFRARGRATGIRLHYAPGWPELQRVEAEFEFRGPALHAVASRGRVGGVEFTDGEFNSADLREGIFAARGKSATDAGRAIRMLQATPLAPSFGALFPGLSASGPVEGDVALFLPVKDPSRRVVTVHAELSGVSLRHRQHPLEIADVTGGLWVRNREIDAPALAGRALGGRWQAAIGTELLGSGDLRTRVTASGRAQAAAIAPLARMPVNAGLTGSTDWRGVLEVERDADVKRPARGTVELSSDLRGLASALPSPFGKVADTARPLEFAARFDGIAGPRIEASLGRDVRALLQWRGRADAAPVERGLVVFGGARPEALPQGPGLRLAGRLEDLSLTKILDLKWDGPRGRPIQEWLAGADLSVERFEALGYPFGNVSGSLRPGNRAWDATVAGESIAGRLTVPYAFPGEVPMVLDLAKLHIGARAPGEGDRPDPDPRKLPAIRVSLGDLVFDGRRFGRVDAELSRGTAGMTLNRFTMSHPAFTAEGSGSWLVRGQAAECRLDFEVESGDVEAFMGAMRLGTGVEAEKGRATAHLTWPGPPEVSALGRLSGRFDLSAENGRLTAVEPGAGRVFSLMSLTHLPRRLALDFNDLTGEGLAFDTLTGTFRLTDGDAYTDNVTLRGSAAEIGLAGHANLRDRTYDQTAVVTGQLGASLGVAGALAGGPAVGAALLLFSQIFKEPLKGVTRGYYRITGSWDDPQVRRIDAREAKDDRQASQGPS